MVVQALNKRYGDTTAVADLTFAVRPGIALLGEYGRCLPPSDSHRAARVG
jgi:ABC-type multidrug transport system ATPase subunit